jgi:hypothetical protein
MSSAKREMFRPRIHRSARLRALFEGWDKRNIAPNLSSAAEGMHDHPATPPV